MFYSFFSILDAFWKKKKNFNKSNINFRAACSDEDKKVPQTVYALTLEISLLFFYNSASVDSY